MLLKHALFLALIVSFTSTFGQEKKVYKATYLNLPPLFRTAIEAGQEFSFNKNRALDYSTGLVINSAHIPGYHKADPGYDVSIRSGLMFKATAKIIARKSENKPGPYLGLFINNVLGYEKATSTSHIREDYGQQVNRISYTLGTGISAGIVPARTSRFGIEPGVQVGVGHYSGMLDWQAYTPGMGRNLMGLYSQTILKMRFQKEHK
jgi:hypothetical protein